MEYSDTKRAGLRFRISCTGRATWLYEKRVKNGPKRRHTLGTWPAVGLSEARAKALELEAEASKGIDRVAIAETNRKAAELAAASVVTVRDTIATYHELHLRHLRRGEERRRQLEQSLDGHLSKSITELTRKEMQAAIDEKAAEGRIVFANRIKAALSAFSKWAWQRGYTTTDHGASLVKAGSEKARERTPTVSEVRQIYQATFDLGPLWGPMFRLLVLTGQRRGEVLGLRWSQVDLEKATITKPGSETKNGKPHITHLSEPAFALLRNLSKERGKRSSKRDLVFTTTGITPVSGVTKAKRRLDMLLGEEFEHWRIHDLRTALASALAEADVSEGVVDRILNHSATGSAPSAVARVYNQADLLPQRAAALDRWAEMVTNDRGYIVKLVTAL